MKSSEIITEHMKRDGHRFYSCDNVSEFIASNDIDLLIEELTGHFEKVLETLLIDWRNDPNAKGTPKRMAKMYFNEILSGRYEPEPDAAAFPNDGIDRYKGMLVTKSAIRSICSHHHQPVSGNCYIGIIPGDKVIGLSKYTRIAQHHARRGTLQEELTVRIAQRIQELTETQDVGVYIEATHGCCSNRGIMSPDSTTQTCTVYGLFDRDASTKAEFFQQIQMQKGNRI
jgi:GTP cyclohydrolase I